MKAKILFLWLICLITASCNYSKNDVTVYPFPEGETLNVKYKVSANGVDVPVYNVKIGSEKREDRATGMDDKLNSYKYFDIAGMAYFDMKKGPVKITVTVGEEITKAKVLPSSFGITPQINGNSLTFEIDRPRHLTIDINGDYVRSLHIIVNPEETDIPNPDDPNVIYFGPGIHEVACLEVTDNKTVYIAGGAIVKGITHPPYDPNDFAARRAARRPTFLLSGNNIVFRGRGIVDQEPVPREQSHQIMLVRGNDIKVEGVTLCNSSSWTLSLNGANNVNIDNVKIFGHRANSDGIDICACHDVLVENCFLRTLDDLIVVKTLRGTGEAGRIIARKCVLWNEVANALSIGAELTSNVEDVLFTDCDIIHDHCREWSLRIYQTDSGLIKNVRFENIRIEESINFISLWINTAMWTTDTNRGHIEDVVFKDITVNNSGRPLAKEFEFLGYDADHAINNVLIENVVINGKKVVKEDIKMNDFVYNVIVK